MIISHVVALSNNNVIGVDNNLPWNLKTDLSHFKEYTTNKVIVMGRKTYESIGRPLPNRLNYVVSQTINHIAGAFVFDSIESAIKNARDYCKENGLDEVVIIGGGFLFRDTLPITNRLVLTKVNCEIEGDVFYPEIDLSDWVEKDSRDIIKDKDNDYDFRVSTYEKLK